MIYTRSNVYDDNLVVYTNESGDRYHPNIDALFLSSQCGSVDIVEAINILEKRDEE